MTKQLKGRAIIAKVIETIGNPDNWIRRSWAHTPKGSYIEPHKANEECKFCVGGAVFYAGGAEVNSRAFDGQDGSTQVGRVFQHIHAAIKAFPDHKVGEGVATFNDTRPHSEVMRMLYDARARIARDPWFRKSAARIAGTEKHVQRARRAVKKALPQPAQQAA